MLQLDMDDCAALKKDKAELEMQEVYEKLNRKISPEGRQKLKDAEKAWAEYRKKQCAFDTMGTLGGSVHPMILSYCYENYAVKHGEDLEYQLDCVEGDLSCGGQ